jgi:hypothetical protein
MLASRKRHRVRGTYSCKCAWQKENRDSSYCLHGTAVSLTIFGNPFSVAGDVHVQHLVSLNNEVEQSLDLDGSYLLP